MNNKKYKIEKKSEKTKKQKVKNTFVWTRLVYTRVNWFCAKEWVVWTAKKESLSRNLSLCADFPLVLSKPPPFLLFLHRSNQNNFRVRYRDRVWKYEIRLKKWRRNEEETKKKRRKIRKKKKKKKDFTTFSEFILTQSIKLFFQKDFHSSENRNLKVRSHNKLHEKKRKNRKRKKNSESVISKSNLFLSLSPPPSLPPSFPLSLFLSLYFSLSCVYSREMYTG